MTIEEIDTIDINEQIAQRKIKLQALRHEGIAFPNDFHKDTFAEDLFTQFANKTAEELESLH